jgi:hypothetical protein
MQLKEIHYTRIRITVIKLRAKCQQIFTKCIHRKYWYGYTINWLVSIGLAVGYRKLRGM